MSSFVCVLRAVVYVVVVVWHTSLTAFWWIGFFEFRKLTPRSSYTGNFRLPVPLRHRSRFKRWISCRYLHLGCVVLHIAKGCGSTHLANFKLVSQQATSLAPLWQVLSPTTSAARRACSLRIWSLSSVLLCRPRLWSGAI